MRSHLSPLNYTAAPTLARFAVYTLVLFSSFNFDLFWLDSGLRNGCLGYDSHLVLNRMKFAAEGLPWWQPNYLLTDSGTLAYGSQIGLQGILLSAVQQRLGGDARLFAYGVAMLWSLLTAATLAAFFASAARCFGAVAAGVAVGLTSLSPILLEFSTSLFWSSFLLFAPFVFTWMLYPRCSRSRRGLLALHLGIAVLVGLKCTCGYEYFTSVALSPWVAIVFHRAASEQLDRRCLVTLFGAGCAALAGVIATLSIHSWQLHCLIGGSGLEAIVGVATRQTVAASHLRVFDFSNSPLQFLPDHVSYPVNCFFNYFQKPAFVLPKGLFGEGAMVSVKTMTTAALAFMVAAALRRKSLSPISRGLAAAMAVSLVTSLSWQALAKNHMCVHLHLNQVVFFLPYLLLLYLALGFGAERLLERAKLLPWATACGLPIAMLLIAAAAAGSLQARQRTKLSACESSLVAMPRVETFLNGQQPAGSHKLSGCVDAVHDFELFDLSSRELNRSAFGLDRSNHRGRSFTGWAIDGDDPQAVKSFVVLQAGRLYPAVQVVFFERDDVEKILNTVSPRAGYRFWVALPNGPAEERPRVFVVTGKDGCNVCELPGPG